MLLLITFNYLLIQNACDIKNDRKDNILQYRHCIDGESSPYLSVKHQPIQYQYKVGSYTIKLLFCLGFTFIITLVPLLLNQMEEFNNLFNSNLMGPCLAIILLIGYTSAPSTQRLSYGRNIIKLKTEKAVTEKGNKDIYIGHFN